MKEGSFAQNLNPMSTNVKVIYEKNVEQRFFRDGDSKTNGIESNS